jgi:hypothetical protein
MRVSLTISNQAAGCHASDDIPVACPVVVASIPTNPINTTRDNFGKSISNLAIHGFLSIEF